MNNKKILLYGGVALVLGAITFFVWSFFQKRTIPIGDTEISLGTKKEDGKDEDGATENQTDSVLDNIDIKPSNSQIRQIDEDSTIADLDAFIKGQS